MHARGRSTPASGYPVVARLPPARTAARVLSAVVWVRRDPRPPCCMVCGMRGRARLSWFPLTATCSSSPGSCGLEVSRTPPPRGEVRRCVPPVYGQGGPPLRSTSSTPIPHWPASRPRLNEPTIGLQRDGGREETTRRRAAQTPGARAASLSIDEPFDITDDFPGYAHHWGDPLGLCPPSILLARCVPYADLPPGFTIIVSPRNTPGKEEREEERIRGDCRCSHVAVSALSIYLSTVLRMYYAGI